MNLNKETQALILPFFQTTERIHSPVCDDAEQKWEKALLQKLEIMTNGVLLDSNKQTVASFHPMKIKITYDDFALFPEGIQQEHQTLALVKNKAYGADNALVELPNLFPNQLFLATINNYDSNGVLSRTMRNSELLLPSFLAYRQLAESIMQNNQFTEYKRRRT